MPVSQYTELYPKKFARQIIQCLRKEKTGPWGILRAEEENPHPSKRRRLDQKTSMSKALLLANPTWEEVMKAADEDAPRVGLKIVTEGALIEAVRLKCPDQIINHLVLCRGMDRMVGPNVRIAEGVAPIRRFACIRRRFEE